MITRFTRYPGGKILGFGTPTQMQKRHCYGPTEGQFAALIGIIVTIPTLAIYLTCKSYKYFHNNYEIVRKDRKNDKNIDLNKKNISEEHQSIRRPGMGTSAE